MYPVKEFLREFDNLTQMQRTILDGNHARVYRLDVNLANFMLLALLLYIYEVFLQVII